MRGRVTGRGRVRVRVIKLATATVWGDAAWGTITRSWVRLTKVAATCIT